MGLIAKINFLCFNAHAVRNPSSLRYIRHASDILKAYCIFQKEWNTVTSVYTQVEYLWHWHVARAWALSLPILNTWSTYVITITFLLSLRPNAPFLTWTTSDCEQWLSFLGLTQYSAALRCWCSSASNHLSRATPAQLDKQLGVRHPLHRKKLQLAIAARMGAEGTLGTNSPGDCQTLLSYC